MLSNNNIDDLKAGARVEVDTEKEILKTLHFG